MLKTHVRDLRGRPKTYTPEKTSPEAVAKQYRM